MHLPVLTWMAATLWMVDPRASKVDISGGVTAEVRGGRAPTDPSRDPEPSFLAILNPNIDLQIISRRVGTWSIGYAPRMQVRFPNRSGLDRPLFLHEIYTRFQSGVTRRFSISADVRADLGELDYAALQLAVGDGQANLPPVQVSSYAVVVGDLTFTGLLSPTWTLIVAPHGEYRAPIGDTRAASNEAGGLIPDLSRADLPILARTQLTARDGLEFGVTPTLVDYDGETTFVSGNGIVAWDRRLLSRLVGRIDAGIFMSYVLRSAIDDGDATTDPDNPDPDQAVVVDEGPTFEVFPVGNVSLNGRMFENSRWSLEGTVAVGVQGFFDRVTETVEPRANLLVGLTAELPPRWSFGINGTMYTPATANARVFGTGVTAYNPPESVIQAQTPIVYSIDDFTRIEFGTILSVRSTHFRASDFRFSQLETWLYVAARWGRSTARGRRETGERSSGTIGTGTGATR